MIEVGVDDEVYCSIDPNIGFYTSFVNNLNFSKSNAWLWSMSNAPKIAPFDKEFYLTFGVGVGGFNEFNDVRKPWKDRQIKAMKYFWDVMKPKKYWPRDESQLEIDYVKVYALDL